MKCPGLPGWECGRLLIGGGRECIVHGDIETIRARWDAVAPEPVRPRETWVADEFQVPLFRFEGAR